MKYLVYIVLLALVTKDISSQLYCYVCNDCNDPVSRDHLQICNEENMINTTTEPPATTETEPPAVTEPNSTTDPTVTTDITEPPATTEPPTTNEPPATTEPPVTTEPPGTTEPPATIEPPVSTEPPATTESPATTEPPAATETTESESTVTEDSSNTTTTFQPDTSIDTTITITDIPDTSSSIVTPPSTTTVGPGLANYRYIPKVFQRFRRSARQDVPYTCFIFNHQVDGQTLTNRGCVRRMDTAVESCQLTNDNVSNISNCRICDSNECNSGTNIAISLFTLITSLMIILRLNN